jgi:hypothetical protein
MRRIRVSRTGSAVARGARATAQGSDLGGEVLHDSLKAVDESGLPAYLETPNPRTIPFYERHGLRVTGSTRTKDCPVITFMLREPAGAQR